MPGLFHRTRRSGSDPSSRGGNAETGQSQQGLRRDRLHCFIGLAIDGTGAGRTTRKACPLCHPVQDANGKVTCQTHNLGMIGVVGTGSPYRSTSSRMRRATANMPLANGSCNEPFLHTADAVNLPIIARLKHNLPELSAAVEARFGQQTPHQTFAHGEDWIEVWDAADFDPWNTLDWPTVRVLRYRRHKKNGTGIQPEWLTNFSIAKLGTRTFFKLAKSRWEIENQEFNDAKNLYGMEHIQHHHPNSMLANWLFLPLAMMIERLYRIRYLHRGTHPMITAMQLKDTLWLHLKPAHANTS